MKDINLLLNISLILSSFVFKQIFRFFFFSSFPQKKIIKIYDIIAHTQNVYYTLNNNVIYKIKIIQLIILFFFFK